MSWLFGSICLNPMGSFSIYGFQILSPVQILTQIQTYYTLIVLDRSKTQGADCLGPITNPAQISHLAFYLQHTSSPRGGGGGCTEHLRPIQRSCNVYFPTFLRISPRQLHFPRFSNRQAHVFLTTALQTPTSI